MKLWKKMGLTAALAAGFGMAGAGAVNAVTATKNASDTQTTATASNASTASTEKSSGTSAAKNSTAKTATKTSTSSLKSDSDLSATETSSDKELTAQQVAANTMPAMVAITNTSVQNVQSFFGSSTGQTAESISKGTGIIIGEDDKNILIATNAHVISDAQQLSVAFVDNSAASATVVGSDTSADLAVIRVSKSDISSSTMKKIRTMSIGSSSDTEVGESVVAIGNALGYGQSVSKGIISAKNRTIETQDETTGQTSETTGLLQTDAAINPGNSGGALLNMKGELVGINSAKYADESVEGMGYAIPIDKAEPILEKLAKGDSTARGTSSSSKSGSAYLGVTCTGINAEYASYYDIPEGVYIKDVASGSAADNAGLESGDIIIAVGNKKVSSTEGLKKALAGYKAGDTAKLTIARQSSVSDIFSGNLSDSNYTEGTVTVTFGSSSSAGSSKSGSGSSNSDRSGSRGSSEEQQTAYANIA